MKRESKGNYGQSNPSPIDSATERHDGRNDLSLDVWQTNAHEDPRYVQGQVEQSAEGAPSALQEGRDLRPYGDG